MRVLVSHHCGLGSFPRPGVICGLSLLLVLSLMCIGEQGWRSGESTRLPPLWPGFDSQTRHHMWVEFVVGSLLALRGFSLVFPSLQKPTFPNSNSNWNLRATGLSVARLLGVSLVKQVDFGILWLQWYVTYFSLSAPHFECHDKSI